MRIMVQIGTIEAVMRGKYFIVKEGMGSSSASPISEAVNLDKKVLEKAALGSRMYSSEHVFPKNFTKRNKATEIMVMEGLDKTTPIAFYSPLPFLFSSPFSPSPLFLQTFCKILFHVASGQSVTLFISKASIYVYPLLRI